MDKHRQLGMNHSTASHRLRVDIIWAFILETDRNKCYWCGKEMTRDSFSIEHKVPWFNSEDPKKLFFDLNNISFSHLSCNTLRGRGKRTPHITEDERLAKRRSYYHSRDKDHVRKLRRAQYLRTGT